MVDKSELAIATSQIQHPIPFFIELFFNLLSQMITVSTIKLTSYPVRHKYLGETGFGELAFLSPVRSYFAQNFYYKT